MAVFAVGTRKSTQTSGQILGWPGPVVVGSTVDGARDAITIDAMARKAAVATGSVQAGACGLGLVTPHPSIAKESYYPERYRMAMHGTRTIHSIAAFESRTWCVPGALAGQVLRGRREPPHTSSQAHAMVCGDGGVQNAEATSGRASVVSAQLWHKKTHLKHCSRLVSP